MSNFNANDIFEIAIQIEKNGALFYRKAAEKVSNNTQKNFLLELASMEDDHEKTFAELQKKLKDSENLSTAFDPDDENAAYLKALADMRVFADKELPQDNVKQDNFKQIIISAIQAEKDSIVFYLGMKAMVPEKMGKARLNDIIKEEMGHIKVLVRKLSEIKA
jgi:rubrerythrin